MTASTIVLGAILVAALAAPLLSPYPPNAQLDVVALKNLPPSLAHPLGTDPFSRDVLSRVLHGARVSLGLGLGATAVGLAIALVVGAVAGMNPRGAPLIMGAVDLIRAIPRKLLLLSVTVVVPHVELTLLAILLGALSWTATCQVIHAQTCALREQEFVTAARAMGASPMRLMSRHIVPHLTGTLGAAGSLMIADIVAVEAGLSFLGLGVRPPTASWGAMLQDGVPHLATAGWTVAAPCVLLALTVMAATRVADELSAGTSSGGGDVPAIGA